MNKKIESKTAGLIVQSDYKRPTVKFSYWLMFAMLILLSAVALIPIIWAALSGFKSVQEFYSVNPSFFPREWTVGEAGQILEQAKFQNALINNVIIFALVWIGDVVVGGMAGYTISRLKPTGSGVLFKMMLWTMMMPMGALMVPQFIQWVDFPIFGWNMMNTWWPFFLPSLCSVYHIMLFKNFFDNIPNSYIESAKLDGATDLGIFAKIIVPLSKPIIATISVFVFNATWNNFMTPYLLIKDPDMAPVALRLYLVSQDYAEPAQLLAAFVVMIPAIIMFFICSKMVLGTNLNVGVKE